MSIIDNVNYPSDIKKLSRNELKTLAKEELIKPNPINVTLLKVKTLSTLNSLFNNSVCAHNFWAILKVKFIIFYNFFSDYLVC